MKTYTVISFDEGSHRYNGLQSTGFGSREAAERFAAGLAASGKCIAADIHEERDEDEDEE